MRGSIWEKRERERREKERIFWNKIRYIFLREKRRGKIIKNMEIKE